MKSSDFFGVTLFPDGSIYSEESWDISLLKEHRPVNLKNLISLDSIKRKYVLSTEIGNLEVVWSGSQYFGVASILLGGVLINSALYLRGHNEIEEKKLLKFYVNSWSSYEVVQELNDHKKDIFDRIFDVELRPLMFSINWATIPSSDYDEIAYYDLFLGSLFFEK